MSAEEDRKLNEMLANTSTKVRPRAISHGSDEACFTLDGVGVPGGSPDAEVKELKGLVQWTTSDGKRFVPASQTAQKITPGVYEIQMSQSIGIFFERVPVLTQGLLRFPQTNSEKVVHEIQKFWDKEPIFREYGLTHKRGIIMWGPPGSGKSCTIQLIMKDVVDRQGVVIKFTHPALFNEGMRKFREIEPSTPVVVLMEDIDSIIENFNESEVLNILDGVNQIEKAVFLATTNYPERLGGRIINRPSRFDKRFFIGHPDPESRKLYLRHIIGDAKITELNIDINRWVEDTEEFSIAHLKELFTAVVILGDEYDIAIETLRSMREKTIKSDDDEFKPSMGFSPLQGKSMRKVKEYKECQ